MDKRSDFIKEMYRVYWDNMARSMDGVWKTLAPITVAGTIIAGVEQKYFPAPLGLALAIIIVLWALNMTIEMNQWHRRNLFFVAKAERFFLNDLDYGRQLPKKYKKPLRNWVSFYSINAIVFLAFLELIVIYGSFWKFETLGYIEYWKSWELPSATLIIGLGSTYWYAREQEKVSTKIFIELFEGKSKNSKKNNRHFKS
jgi:hypothetical protein